jgi:ATP-binding protein involved in chromosome partitioning
MKHTITYIGIASGKGGVGKSTVTAQLAYAFRDLGHQVGIIDADIYGASIPSILEVEDIAAIEEDMNLMIPIEKEGIEIISTEFFMSKEKPVMWRGPMLGKMLTEFIQSVKWKEDTSIILIDLPPGTGDVALDIQKLIPQASMIVVTTPHPNASMVAVKAGLGAKQMGHKMLGVIENMSYFEHPTTHEKFPIFGAGGGETVATMLNVPLLGQVPIYSGESFIDKHDKIKTMYHDIASKIEVNHV